MRLQEEIEKSTARLFKIVWWQQHKFSKESEEEETKEILKQIEEESIRKLAEETLSKMPLKKGS